MYGSNGYMSFDGVDDYLNLGTFAIKQGWSLSHHHVYIVYWYSKHYMAVCLFIPPQFTRLNWSVFLFEAVHPPFFATV